MTTSLTRLGAALVLVVTASLATACASSPPSATEPTGSTAGTPTAPAPASSAEPTGAAAAAGDPTCETIIADATVADFESIGWTARADPFYIGETELPEGLQCVWADFEGPAGDHIQLFGWAPIDPDAEAKAEDDLVAQGWVRESGDEGVYITESPETTIATDDEGYGLTYLFGDGWVKVADTKQGLLLIEWPPR
jgi:hypothetical protein